MSSSSSRNSEVARFFTKAVNRAAIELGEVSVALDTIGQPNDSQIAKFCTGMSRPRRSRIAGKRPRSALRVKSRVEGVGLNEDVTLGTVTLGLAW